MNLSIVVENIKCHGCANTIKNSLKQFNGIDEVIVNVESGEICITGHAEPELIIKKLADLGYPEVGQNGLSSKIKSYMSCAVGRINGLD